ncbi:MAG TPA: porin [Candidatus Polarisedimenticolaceae bacterium]|nr:porin [Candidatus Polarisedimenticolaceae bacterium]
MNRLRWQGLAGIVMAASLSLPVAAQDEPKPETTTDASQGFVTFKSGDNSLTLGAWGQFRATVDDKEEFDADTAGTGFGQEDGTTAAFNIPRLRVYVQGTVYKPWMKYKIEIEVANLRTDATNNLNNGRITDGYFEFAKLPGATLRIGQYKVPFGLQELTQDMRQEFVDRSIASAKFAPSRDVGLMLHGQFLEKKLGYQVGVFNGGGQNNPQDDVSFLYVGRVVFDPLGEYRPVESATEHPEKNILHFGIGARGGEVPRGLSSVGTFEDPNDETALNAEVAWKFRRFFAMGEYYVQTDEQANPTAGPDIDANGFHAQFGVMVVPKKQEIAVRYAEIEPDEDVPDAKLQEMRAVYGYFWRSHNMKFQADFGQLTYGENFAALSALALRAVSPALLPANRLVPLPGQEIKDKQFRAQFVLAF